MPPVIEAGTFWDRFLINTAVAMQRSLSRLQDPPISSAEVSGKAVLRGLDAKQGAYGDSRAHILLDARVISAKIACHLSWQWDCDDCRLQTSHARVPAKGRSVLAHGSAAAARSQV